MSKCIECKKVGTKWKCLQCGVEICSKCLKNNDIKCPYCSDERPKVEKTGKKKKPKRLPVEKEAAPVKKKEKEKPGMVMKSVESSNIGAVGFEGGTLRVKFKNGSEYEYKSVPEEYYEAMMKAKSAGSFLTQNIKGRFRFTKI